LIAHDHRHKLELPDRTLEEGQLDFQRMLRVVRRRRVPDPGKLDRRVHLGELCRKGLVHRNLAEWGRVRRAVIHRGKAERFVMRRRNHYHAVEFPALQQGV